MCNEYENPFSLWEEYAAMMTAADLGTTTDRPPLAERGTDVEIDYAFKRSLTCPICGALGEGLQISEE